MQSTTCFHYCVTNTIFQQTYFLFDDPVAFYPTDGMFDADSNGRDATIFSLLRGCQFPPTGFFLGLNNGDSLAQKALEPHILIKTTSGRQGISRQISDAFIVYLALISGAQQANVTGLIDHEQVFDRVALLLATIIFLLVLGISRAVDRAFSAIMPKRGGMGTPSARGLASSMAKSSAVRAGSRSCRANA